MKSRLQFSMLALLDKTCFPASMPLSAACAPLHSDILPTSPSDVYLSRQNIANSHVSLWLLKCHKYWILLRIILDILLHAKVGVLFWLGRTSCQDQWKIQATAHLSAVSEGLLTGSHRDHPGWGLLSKLCGLHSMLLAGSIGPNIPGD